MTLKTGGEAIQNYRRIVNWADFWYLHGIHLRVDIKKINSSVFFFLFMWIKYHIGFLSTEKENHRISLFCRTVGENVVIGLPLYLFGCGINGSGGMNVGDLRGGVDWWHRVLCGLSSAAVLV